jgi:hypothetical protein
MRTPIVATLVLCSGCSWIFAQGSPRDHARRDDYACTSSWIIPAADVAWGGLNLVWGTGRAIVAPESFGDVSQAQSIGVTLGWVAISAFSAYSGFTKVRACREAQAATMARLGPTAQRRYREPLLYAGGATFGVTYLGTLIATAAMSEEDFKARSLYYVAFPLIGPLGLAASGLSQGGHVPALLASSALQATGAVLLFLGTRSRVVVLPAAIPGGAGVTLVLQE